MLVGTVSYTFYDLMLIHGQLILFQFGIYLSMVSGTNHSSLDRYFFRTMIKTIKHIGHKTSISVGDLTRHKTSISVGLRRAASGLERIVPRI